jgi:hypothetical protein
MIWNLEPAKLRSRELVKTRRHEPAKSWNRESVKFRSLLEVKFGSHDARRFSERGDSRTSKKQSQRRRLKKSGFSVWTSGRLVNVWDVKDIRVHVHTRNILWVRGCFRNAKVPSSPYKRGREGTCKRIHNFWGLSNLWEDFLSPITSLLCLNVPTVLSLVFGDLIRIFEYPQHLVPHFSHLDLFITYPCHNWVKSCTIEINLFEMPLNLFVLWLISNILAFANFHYRSKVI